MEKEHRKARVKVKGEGHGQEIASEWLDDRALPLVTKGCEVQEVLAGGGLGLSCSSIPHHS